MTVEIRHRLRVTIPDLSVRVGMDAGPVIMFEGDDYIGRAVNVAARICDESGPDQVLATWDVASEMPDWVTPGQSRRVVLKGLAHTVEVTPIEVVASLPNGGATDPVCGLTIPTQLAIRAPGFTKSTDRFCSLDCAEAFSNRTPHRGLPFRTSS